VFTGPFGLRDATDVCGGDELPAEAVAAGLSLLAERSVLLADRPAGNEARFVLPVTLRAYGGQMLRRLARTRSSPHGISDGRTTAGRTRAAPRGSKRYDVAARPGAARIGISGRPGENTCIAPASPGSLFAYRFDDLRFYVVDSGFVVD